jgi:cytidylate kinase
VLITLSGLPGSGTSTVARSVASRLGLDHLDGGTVFRTLASERGVTLAEFARIAEDDDSIDRALDDRLVERARDGAVLLESRLAGWLATRAALRALRIWIHCDGHDADEALATNQEREASERQRYQDFYGIDLADLSVYDLVVDSTSTPPDAIIDQIVEAAAALAGP